MANVLKTLAKSVFVSLGLKAAGSAIDVYSRKFLDW